MRRREFLDFVVSAVRAANRPEIARVETVYAAFRDPTGIRITMTDGDVLSLRVLITTAGCPTVPTPPSPPQLPDPSIVDGHRRQGTSGP